MDGGKLRLVVVCGLLAASGWLVHDAGASDDGASAGGALDLSGVYDLMIHDNNLKFGFYHCVVKLDHDTGTNTLDTLSQCYPDDDLGDPNAEPRHDPPGEGPDLLAGPPPPPPYNWRAPSVGAGTYTPAAPPADHLDLVGCLPNLGGLFGPNAIIELNFYQPGEYLDAMGLMVGQVLVHRGQGSVACEALTPQGSYSDNWSVYLYPIDDVNGAEPNFPAVWRTLGDDDLDDDGCTDEQELVGTAGCGDDPFNDLDLAPAGTDVSGDYLLAATVAEADACWGGTYGSPPTACFGDGTLIPGLYHLCGLQVAQAGAALTARTYCYIDSPAITVNPQVAGAKTCPPAAAQFCGDGLVGAAPPGRTFGLAHNFGDVDDQHAVLNGQISSGRVVLSGCIQDRDGMAALGHVYVSLDVDAHSGQGDIVIASGQTQANCLAGTPTSPPPAVDASLARQALTPQQRDTDSDGCPDQRELTDAPGMGGLRDMFNHYDYLNPSGDGLNRIDDIILVLQEYFEDDLPGPIDYDSTTDRTAIAGANAWNVGPPDGLQRVDDIVHGLKQYFHDC